MNTNLSQIHSRIQALSTIIYDVSLQHFGFSSKKIYFHLLYFQPYTRLEPYSKCSLV
ncbi:hypothetical protein HanPSC8_Chr10g0427411 [Helianthus annuus]|nr:hypothetical protein HanPSC8_Chr10g0427411 [Helianthus annuus]